jgi:hypothetical protein
VHTRLDEDKAELSVTVLAVALKVLADRNLQSDAKAGGVSDVLVASLVAILAMSNYFPVKQPMHLLHTIASQYCGSNSLSWRSAVGRAYRLLDEAVQILRHSRVHACATACSWLGTWTQKASIDTRTLERGQAMDILFLVLIVLRLTCKFSWFIVPLAAAA